MKEDIETLLASALEALKHKKYLPHDLNITIKVSPTRQPEHGDFTTTLALLLAKTQKTDALSIAQQIVDAFPTLPSWVKDIQIVHPGFINFFLSDKSRRGIVQEILEGGTKYGRSDVGHNQRVHIEYVSANPTGPLHIGHGRGAAYGSCVANLLEAIGFKVHREYYVNDAGRQMDILALSIWIRYLQNYDSDLSLPKGAYQGQYIIDIATLLKAHHLDRFYHTLVPPFPKTAIEDEEEKLDAYLHTAHTLLGPDFQTILDFGLSHILTDIQNDLLEFGVAFDEWFFESRLFKEGFIADGITLLKQRGFVYVKEGATWFKAKLLGDREDRVLVRQNGKPTYFASDVAYHLYKYKSGYDRIINIFGADHHGYVPRIRAFLKGLGEDPEKLHILLVQFASLYRGHEKIAMSTRGGTFITLRELREEVGKDAARFFYIQRKPDQHLEFDLELAKSQSNNNPVYYIQYAHARICSVLKQVTQNIFWDKEATAETLSTLQLPYEKNILRLLGHYRETVKKAGLGYAPQILATYLHELAHAFHSYYNAEKFLVPQIQTRNARLCLIKAVSVILSNGLGLLGITAPDHM